MNDFEAQVADALDVPPELVGDPSSELSSWDIDEERRRLFLKYLRALVGGDRSV